MQNDFSQIKSIYAKQNVISLKLYPGIKSTLGF